MEYFLGYLCLLLGVGAAVFGLSDPAIFGCLIVSVVFFTRADTMEQIKELEQAINNQGDNK